MIYDLILYIKRKYNIKNLYWDFRKNNLKEQNNIFYK